MEFWCGGTRQLSLANRGSDHFQRCPFCGETFDLRDLGQVFPHYDCQFARDRLASDAQAAADFTAQDDRTPPQSANVIPLRRARP